MKNAQTERPGRFELGRHAVNLTDGAAARDGGGHLRR
jgi:hypothetical protein